MDYHKITITTSLPELTLAFIQHLPFDTFEEQENRLLAYLPTKDFTPTVKVELEKLAKDHDFTYQVELIPYQNWNAVWESNFTPIRVGNFCGIRADFHPPFDPPVAHEIRIQPKMAFGTGHHATTYMMMEAMSTIPFSGRSVFDYGCGTGVLAILAAQLGAAKTDAVDIEYPAYENTLEHLELNQIDSIQVYEGDLQSVPPTVYNVILANINRNVILASLPSLYKRLSDQGDLLISGVMEIDQTTLLEATENQGFITKHIKSNNNWICVHLTK